MKNKHNINLVIAPLSINGGMAGNKRLKNLAYFLEKQPGIRISNFSLSTFDYKINYHWEHIQQINIRGNKLTGPVYLFKYLLKQKQKDANNILYYYGYPSIFNIWLLVITQRIGYKVIIDTVEDYTTYKKYTSLFDQFNKRTAGWLLLKIRHFCNGVIVISNYLERRMNDILKNKRPLLHLPISVNKIEFPHKANSTTTGKISFFYGGSFVYKDGVEELIKAFHEFSLTTPDVELILTGKASNKADIDNIYSLLKRLNSKAIHVIGFVDDQKYIDYIMSCQVLCMPRKNVPFALAGFPFKMGEYMATGNAVLASAIGDLHTIFSEEEVCFYEPDNQISLIAKMKKLAEDQQYRKSIGEKGRIKALTIFDAEKHAQELRAFFEKI